MGIDNAIGDESGSEIEIKKNEIWLYDAMPFIIILIDPFSF